MENVIHNTVKYCLWNDTYNGEECVAIYGLYVHPKMRRKGIARMLLSTVIEEIKSKYPNHRIVAEAIPYGDGIRLDAKRLKVLYAQYSIETLNI